MRSLTILSAMTLGEVLVEIAHDKLLSQLRLYVSLRF